jgi:catechol-2,3-dioxygenase
MEGGRRQETQVPIVGLRRSHVGGIVQHFPDAPTREDLDRHRQRWQECGLHVLELDHDFCVSIYVRDPNNNMVEFCHTVRDFSPEERAHAIELLNDAAPALEKHDVNPKFHPAI